MGLQIDMWTDTETHTAFACLSMTSVEEPGSEMIDPQLLLCAEILAFEVFPFNSKTGANIKAWVLGVLAKHGIVHRMVTGVAPDGAADGQCAFREIETLAEKVDTCLLHVEQRAVLFSIGLAGATSKNPEAKALLRKHNRTVTLTQQALAVGKQVRDMQTAAGVPDHEIKTTTTTALTRWGNQFLQVSRDCELRPGLDPAVDKYKREHKGEKEASVEVDESE